MPGSPSGSCVVWDQFHLDGPKTKPLAGSYSLVRPDGFVLANTTSADAKTLQECRLATAASLTRASGSSETQRSAWGLICGSTDTAELQKKRSPWTEGWKWCCLPDDLCSCTFLMCMTRMEVCHFLSASIISKAVMNSKNPLKDKRKLIVYLPSPS